MIRRVSLKCEGETRNAKRLKCETAVRNGPKILGRFAGPTARGHTKMRNILRNEKFLFPPLGYDKVMGRRRVME